MSTINAETLTFRRWADGVSDELRLLSPFIVVSGVFVLAVAAIGHVAGLSSHVQLTLYTQAAYFSLTVGIPLAVLLYGLYLVMVVREKRPIGRIGRDLATHVLAPRALVGLIIPIMLISYFVSAFSSFKSMIPVLNPFYLDPALAKLDTALHFGIAPWRITHLFFHDFASAMTINFAYNIWFFLIWIFVFCQCLGMAGRRHRAHYLLAFILCWIVIGSVLALMLSSAGPCYYGRITHLPDVFAPLMQQLKTIDAPQAASGSYWHLWSLSTQDMLWKDQFLAKTSMGAGISAMPSMHVSMAFLMAFSAMKTQKWFGRLMLAYALIILFGSVYLGWHYAIDGYVSAAITYLIWRLSGRVIERIDSSDGYRSPPAEH